ncbi:MAG: TIGR00296 family protein [Candidatus Woesearchaeota archaeon]
MSLTLTQGGQLVKLARSSIFSEPILTESFGDKKGVFVTLSSYPSKELRGCIGFIEPIFPLRQAVIKAARAAAFEDPRFPPLSKKDKFTVEVSVLSVPELIKAKSPEDYLKSIKIGSDGLIINDGTHSGLLLPQVFPEWGADERKALEMTCNKAGLSKDAWKEKGCRVYKFHAEIFSELEPEGEIVESKA